jgi:exosome complex component RRP45
MAAPHASHFYNGGYIPIRNDATLQSIAERNFIRTISTHQQQPSPIIDTNSATRRLDGRKQTEYRPVTIQLERQYHQYYPQQHHHHHDNAVDTATTTATATTTRSSGSHTSTTTTTTASSSFTPNGSSTCTGNSATATVTVGVGTRVICHVTSELVAPNIDRPNDGILSLTVDIAPSANTSYRSTTPASTYNNTTNTATLTTSSTSNSADRHQKVLSNHILRTIERCFVPPGGAIDTEALCVVPNAYVWKVNCHCIVLDDSGNVMDAAVLACIAAIRHYRQPIVDLVPVESFSTASNSKAAAATTNTNVMTPRIIPAHIKEPTPLPLLYTPMTISFLLLNTTTTTTTTTTTGTSNTTTSSTATTGVQQQSKSYGSNTATDNNNLAILIDPTQREELCHNNGHVTIGMNVYQEICFLDVTTGYNCEVHLSDLHYCYQIASQQVIGMSEQLESALFNADEQDREQRLIQFQQRQQQQQQQQRLPLPPLPTASLSSRIAAPNEDDMDDTNPANNNNILPPPPQDNEEDIIYRQRALDYTIGHVASKVRENNPTHDNRHPHRQVLPNTGKPELKQQNTLLDSMLRSVQVQSEQNDARNGYTTTTATTTTAINTPMTMAHGTTNATTEGKHKDDDIDDDEEEENLMELQGEFVTTQNNSNPKVNKRKRRKK